MEQYSNLFPQTMHDQLLSQFLHPKENSVFESVNEGNSLTRKNEESISMKSEPMQEIMSRKGANQVSADRLIDNSSLNKGPYPKISVELSDDSSDDDGIYMTKTHDTEESERSFTSCSESDSMDTSYREDTSNQNLTSSDINRVSTVPYYPISVRDITERTAETDRDGTSDINRVSTVLYYPISVRDITAETDRDGTVNDSSDNEEECYSLTSNPSTSSFEVIKEEF